MTNNTKQEINSKPCSLQTTLFSLKATSIASDGNEDLARIPYSSISAIFYDGAGANQGILIYLKGVEQAVRLTTSLSDYVKLDKWLRWSGAFKLCIWSTLLAGITFSYVHLLVGGGPAMEPKPYAVDKQLAPPTNKEVEPNISAQKRNQVARQIESAVEPVEQDLSQLTKKTATPRVRRKADVGYSTFGLKDDAAVLDGEDDANR